MKQKLRSNLTTTGLLLALSLIAAFGAWLAYVTGCAYGFDWSLCRQSEGGWIVMGCTVALIWLWVAWHLSERLRRRLRRGMWSGVKGSGFRVQGSWISNTARFVIEGDWPGQGGDEESHPALYDTRSGWWVETPVDGGTVAWVNRQEFYEWVLDVLAEYHGLDRGKSAIGQRRWEPEIGRVQWMARCRLLDEAGATEYSTSSPTSRRLKRRDSWGIMETLAEVRPVEYQ